MAKYSREELRAMARRYVAAKDAPGLSEDTLKAMLLEVNISVRTGLTAHQVERRIRELAR